MCSRRTRFIIWLIPVYLLVFSFLFFVFNGMLNAGRFSFAETTTYVLQIVSINIGLFLVGVSVIITIGQSIGYAYINSKRFKRKKQEKFEEALEHNCIKKQDGK